MASPQSPSSSAGSGSLYSKQPDLSELVNYFVASKRSLSSASHVWRANEVVNSARVLLEENAVLAAKNTFIRSSVAEQIDVLEALRLGVDEVGQRAHDEFRV
jgi:autophagy-related protein 17